MKESEASKQEREAWEAWQQAIELHREKRIRTTGLLRALDNWEIASVEKVQAVQREEKDGMK